MRIQFAHDITSGTHASGGSGRVASAHHNSLNFVHVRSRLYSSPNHQNTWTGTWWSTERHRADLKRVISVGSLRINKRQQNGATLWTQLSQIMTWEVGAPRSVFIIYNARVRQIGYLSRFLISFLSPNSTAKQKPTTWPCLIGLQPRLTSSHVFANIQHVVMRI